MTNPANQRAPGSGFVSVDNADDTAANCWKLRNEAGLHEGVLLWNIVPWHIVPEHFGSKKKPNPAELTQGARELRKLLTERLTEVSVVLACGLVAQQGWLRHVEPYLTDGPRMIPTWHTGALSLKQPGKREEALSAFQRAAERA